MWHLAAQNPCALGNRAKIGARFAALARNHQHQAHRPRMGILDKPDQRRMGLIQSHAVQVNARFGGHFAARHFLVGFGIHSQRRGAQTLANRGGDMGHCLHLGPLAQSKSGQRRLQGRGWNLRRRWCNIHHGNIAAMQRFGRARHGAP